MEKSMFEFLTFEIQGWRKDQNQSCRSQKVIKNYS